MGGHDHRLYRNVGSRKIHRVSRYMELSEVRRSSGALKGSPTVKSEPKISKKALLKCEFFVNPSVGDVCDVLSIRPPCVDTDRSLPKVFTFLSSAFQPKASSTGDIFLTWNVRPGILTTDDTMDTEESTLHRAFCLETRGAGPAKLFKDVTQPWSVINIGKQKNAIR